MTDVRKSPRSEAEISDIEGEDVNTVSTKKINQETPAMQKEPEQAATQAKATPPSATIMRTTDKHTGPRTKGGSISSTMSKTSSAERGGQPTQNTHQSEARRGIDTTQFLHCQIPDQPSLTSPHYILIIPAPEDWQFTIDHKDIRTTRIGLTYISLHVISMPKEVVMLHFHRLRLMMQNINLEHRMKDFPRLSAILSVKTVHDAANLPAAIIRLTDGVTIQTVSEILNEATRQKIAVIDATQTDSLAIIKLPSLRDLRDICKVKILGFSLAPLTDTLRYRDGKDCLVLKTTCTQGALRTALQELTVYIQKKFSQTERDSQILWMDQTSKKTATIIIMADANREEILKRFKEALANKDAFNSKTDYLNFKRRVWKERSSNKNKHSAEMPMPKQEEFEPL